MVLRSVDGEEIPLKGRPTILLFVATWCGTCAAASVNVRSALGLSGVGAQASIMIREGYTVEKVIETIHAFPTSSESLKIAAQAFIRDVKRMPCCVE